MFHSLRPGEVPFKIHKINPTTNFRSVQHRIPKVLIPEGVVRQCTSIAMADGNFCDYQEFDNSVDGNGLDIRTRNAFNEDIIQFWDEIFEIAERQRK